MATTTFNYGWVKPTIGGDASTWGAELNTDLDGIDAKVFANGSSMSVNGVGAATLPTFATASANFTVNKAAGTNLANINGASNGVLRWVMSLGDATAESGSSTGSDFDIRNCSDAGTIVGSVVSIQRSSGAMFVNAVNATPSTANFTTSAANFSINKAGSGYLANLNGMNNGLLRWQINLGNNTGEFGSNGGSDFQINAFNDAGQTLATPLVITRQTQSWTISSPSVTIAPLGGNSASLALDKPATGLGAQLTGQTNGSSRWTVYLGNNQAESGSNSGSDFVVGAFSDTGALLGYPLIITRSNQAVAFNAPSVSVTGASGANSQLFLNKTGSGGNCIITGQSNGITRWAEYYGSSAAETGSNVGSDYALGRFADNGTVIDFPFSIVRSTGVASFSKTIVNGLSDRSLKENIEPLEDALAKVEALQGVSFDWIADGRRDIGLIAQEVQPIVPEVIQQFGDEGKLAIDYPKLVALLIEAVKELSAEVTALKEQRA